MEQLSLDLFDTGALDFDTPRVSTARIIIFCLLCQKNGYVSYPTKDGKRSGAGRYKGPTMRLADYLAGKPHICQECNHDRT